MSKTVSTMLPLGTIAPDFALNDVTTGQLIKLKSHEHYSATVVMFICNHCPYVKHINPGLRLLAQDYLSRGIRFIAISSNDVDNYPADSPEQMEITALAEQYPFPYLYDENQNIARSYHAACTPDFYVFDDKLSLVYRGQFDDSRPGNGIPISASSLREALDCLLNERPLSMEQKPSLGCNIKWKPNHLP